VIGGAILFALVAAVGIPLQLLALQRTEAAQRRVLTLNPTGLDIAAEPLVNFGPGGRLAAASYGSASWAGPVAAGLCTRATGFALRPREVEVGFLETVAGPRAVLADYCTLPRGGVGLVVALVRPNPRQVQVVAALARGIASATVVATADAVVLHHVEIVRDGVARQGSQTRLASFAPSGRRRA